ncbi:cell division protein ZapA [Altererythrobacter sp.]|nr:cell division protein ZapA [Altererythrobacter sp.]
MNQLELTIGGKSFTIACEPGEEDDVRKLGSDIDAKFQELAPRYEQNLLFAALMLADDLQSAQSARDASAAAQSAMAADTEALRREIATATAQENQLRHTLGDREQELEAIKASQQETDNTARELGTENERLKHAAHSAEQEKSQLRTEISSLKGENETLEEQLLHAKQALAAADRSAADSMASLIEPGMATRDPELAPALERFAGMLENCAAKLEGGLESGQLPS